MFLDLLPNIITTAVCCVKNRINYVVIKFANLNFDSDLLSGHCTSCNQLSASIAMYVRIHNNLGTDHYFSGGKV